MKNNRQEIFNVAQQFEERGRQYERRDLFKQVALALLSSKAASSPVGLLTRARIYAETILEGARLFANEPVNRVEQESRENEEREKAEDASWDAEESPKG
jgi:hypothetical protein